MSFRKMNLRSFGWLPIALFDCLARKRSNGSMHLRGAFAQHYRQDRTFSRVYRPGFEEFVRAQFPSSERWPEHVNVDSYIDFLGPTEADAFDLYVSLIEQYHASPNSRLSFTLHRRAPI
jgi:hypothetical protein